MKFKVKYHKLFFILLSFIPVLANSEVRLPRLMSDGMVLQRDANVKVWGWALAEEKVTINFIGENYSTVADSSGKWSLLLPKLKAGGPYDMKIKASNEITIRNILIGDVWVCSGQSNMGLNMKRVKDKYKDEIKNCGNTNIRLFLVPTQYNFNAPLEDFSSGKWETVNLGTILHFPAVPYFFAKAINNKYNVPVGIINSSEGGAPLEAFLSEDALKKFPEYLKIAEKFKDSAYVKQIINSDKKRISEWYGKLHKSDKGINGEKPWFDITYDASGWKTMHLPSYWEDMGLGCINGAIWFRKEINVPESMTGKPARIIMGRIVDSDSIFINGKFVGATSYQYPPRKYTIRNNLLKPGKNIIVIRVISNIGKGGFIAGKTYQLEAGDKAIDLEGDWQYKVGAVMGPLHESTLIQWQPLGLYNGMINPLINYTIKGINWYQGEANVQRAAEYKEMFPALIKNWREKWNMKDCPFLFVQLPNFIDTNDIPGYSNRALLRESQMKALSVANTGMAVTIDVGEGIDLHPLNKKDVGERLALAAQKVAYGEDVVYSGPVYQSMKIEENKIILTFTNTGSGLIAKGNTYLQCFTIAGPDKKFIKAKAIIKNNTVVVWSDEILTPLSVRYAWADNPEGANLYNKEGLPATPFRTDDWETVNI